MGCAECPVAAIGDRGRPAVALFEMEYGSLIAGAGCRMLGTHFMDGLVCYGRHAMMIRWVWIVMLMVAGVVSARANDPIPDNPTNRQHYAVQLVDTMSTGALVARIANEMTQTAPADKRDAITVRFVAEVEVGVVDQELIRAFALHCTPDELAALTDLCRTAAGRSALFQYTRSMQDAVSRLQPEFSRANRRSREVLKQP